MNDMEVWLLSDASLHDLSSCHTCLVAAEALQRVYRKKQGLKTTHHPSASTLFRLFPHLQAGKFWEML